MQISLMPSDNLKQSPPEMHKISCLHAAIAEEISPPRKDGADIRDEAESTRRQDGINLEDNIQ